MQKIAYLGPENSYSFLAAKTVAGKDDVLVALPSFSEVLENVRNGGADVAVVPIENSIEGNVNEVTDGLILGGTSLYINAEFVLTIDNYLIALDGADFSKIETVVSHWQPLGQCRQTVKKILPNAKIVFADSTSAALGRVTDTKTAAIGGKQLVRKGLQKSNGPVNDVPDNHTRFLVLSKNDSQKPENDKLTIVFEAENKPGGLLKLLEFFNGFKINMTRLESRPHKSALGRYIFVADIMGNISDKNTLSALELIKKHTIFYKYLGGYKENVSPLS